MLVVADTSPLIGLLKIGHVDVLPRLYGSVVVPSEVDRELKSERRAPEIKTFIAAPPPWFSVRDPSFIDRLTVFTLERLRR
jgi:uncharacterized protein